MAGRLGAAPFVERNTSRAGAFWPVAVAAAGVNALHAGGAVVGVDDHHGALAQRAFVGVEGVLVQHEKHQI